MKKLIFVLVVFVATIATAQEKTPFFEKDLIPTYSCMFVSGAAYGHAENLIWHNPHPGDPFLDPYESWKHKHGLINADMYHIDRAIEHASFIIGAAFSVADLKGKKNKGLIILKRVGQSTACFALGMAITYK